MYLSNWFKFRGPLYPQEPGALHVTHKADLLNLTIQEPDLNIYTAIGDKNA